MTKYIFIILFIISALTGQNFKTFSFPSSDGINISADLYETNGKKAPFLLLFHRARWSRGEYRETAPLFNKMGYNCLAIDQRSGDTVNGVANETAQNAVKAGKKTGYIDAYIDLESALAWVSKSFDPKRIIVLGSSYSSSLVFRLAAEHPQNIDGLVAFSPGEYFSPDDYIQSFAKKLNCPVFVTSAAREKNLCIKIFKAVPGQKKKYFLPAVGGFHGSEALWKEHEINTKYWLALKTFFSDYF